MPIYSYRCESCGIQFEREQSFKDAPLKHCPDCNANSLHRVIGPVGVVFKGSGFYATDNKSPSGMKSNTIKEDSGSSEKPESKAGTESSSKESKGSDKKE